MEFYSAIRKNETMRFEDKWMQLEDIMLSEVSQFKKTKVTFFSHTWKMNPKDKHIHKDKHDLTQTYVEYVCNSRTTL
jgi:hypothetical protein